jgi:hypothetical protein
VQACSQGQQLLLYRHQQHAENAFVGASASSSTSRSRKKVSVPAQSAQPSASAASASSTSSQSASTSASTASSRRKRTAPISESTAESKSVPAAPESKIDTQTAAPVLSAAEQAFAGSNLWGIIADTSGIVSHMYYVFSISNLYSYSFVINVAGSNSNQKDSSDIVNDEIQRFLNEQIECEPLRTEQEIEDYDPLTFWKTRTTIYPVLCRVVRKLLCMQATSAPSERVFSAAGQILNKRRMKLNPSTVMELCFLYCNRKIWSQ